MVGKNKHYFKLGKSHCLRGGKMMKSKKFVRLIAVSLVAFTALATAIVGQGAVRAAAGTQSDLTAIAGQGTGRVIVSSTAQDQGTFAAQITLNIHDAQPNTTFFVQRAPDLVPDGVCTGNYIPFAGVSLTTSAGGAGATHFDFHRGAPFVSGRQFDVVFRAIGSDGSILQSECMTVTVK
jgi:hypothetical protein